MHTLCPRSTVIDRYSLPVMQSLWSEKGQFQAWLEVEIAACAAGRTRA